MAAIVFFFRVVVEKGFNPTSALGCFSALSAITNVMAVDDGYK